jgi:hypothetical protein
MEIYIYILYSNYLLGLYTVYIQSQNTVKPKDTTFPYLCASAQLTLLAGSAFIIQSIHAGRTAVYFSAKN